MLSTSTATTRRAAAGALLLLAASGCEEQEAEPLSSSVPTGMALFAVTAAAVWWIVRRHGRRLDLPIVGELAPLRFPRATAALLIGPVLVASAVASAMTSYEVAFGYRYEKTSPFSYDDTVGLSILLAGTLVVCVALATGLARWGQARDRSRRFTARAVVGAVVLGLAMTGVGLVWLPALVAMFLEGERTPDCLPPPRPTIVV